MLLPNDCICHCEAFKASSSYDSDNLLTCYFERKLGRSKSCSISSLIAVQFETVHNWI